MSARSELGAAIAALTGPVPVADAPIRNGAPPIIAIAPGLPYQRPATAVGCAADWRFDVWCLVPGEAIDALDQQDALAELVRQAAEGMTSGAVGQWLGVNRANVRADDLAGVSSLATIVEIRVTL